jgi:hypothetical protein
VTAPEIAATGAAVVAIIGAIAAGIKLIVNGRFKR